MKKIIDFNQDQIEHIQLVQGFVLDFCVKLMESALLHDKSKFSKIEYEAFVESRDSLNQSKDGKDEEYQKHRKGEAIQHHILTNSHHPEYWDNLGEKMPLHEIIIMFFDWYSRSKQKNSSMDGFWDYNLGKLAKQSHAVYVVELLRRDVETKGERK